MQNEVEDFMYKLEGDAHKISMFLHNLLVNDLGLECKLRYKIPFYFNKSWICYLNSGKNNDVEFAFTRGNELSNNHGILESKGRKQVYSITLSDFKEIPLTELHDTIMEAIALDENVPYASKRVKKLD